MVANTNTPTKISYSIVDALKSGMTLGFHGVTTQGASRCGSVAGSHENWIGCVAEVAGTCVLPTVRWMMKGAWWDWQAESFCCKIVTGCLKCDYW